MQIAVIGTGYVGLVTGTCLADSGNDVICVDVVASKVEALRQGRIPIYEPGLEELVERNAAAGRLSFTTDAAQAVAPARLVFLAVGTPMGDDGAADLKYLWQAADSIAPHLRPDAIVITKSTVPVGTGARLAERLRAAVGREVDVASNPEFLKEGAAIEDFVRPDRVVVGVRRPEVAEVLRELYAPFLRTERPFIVMSPESAEMTKYVANALLATKISFINEMANLCQRKGADINDVRRGIGHDSRIGFAFLFPGVGYGGSCFPKDVRAIEAMGREVNYPLRIMAAVDAVNEAQKTILLGPIEEHFGGTLRGRTFAVWGLAFKPRTDDIREAPALALMDRLLAAGAACRVHDPEAIQNVCKEYGERLSYFLKPYEALDGVDALVVMTEWKQYQNPNFAEMRRRMRGAVIFDGRNVYDPAVLRQAGFAHYSIGRAAVRPAGS